MADEVPVSDVLCEAMEYLSKLGSNLRSRSETLKEKKIRKDKLKNAHAVQKAAHKVLLICELSKKSLDNVETGVRKILKLVDASQASIRDGGKVPTSDRSKSHTSEKTKFQFFEYQSRKLKVGKRVPLKHYLSVKVLAKGMPVSMQDKYPVYYDCKLYRARRRIAKKDNTKGSSRTNSCENEIEPESKDEIKKGDRRTSTPDSSDLETDTKCSKETCKKPDGRSKDSRQSSLENDTSKTDSKINACKKKTLSLKRDRKDSVTQKAIDDEDSDSRKESDTEKSDSKTSSNRKEHRKDSTKNNAKDDGDSDFMKEDTEKSDSKKTSNRKEHRKNSAKNKAKDDEDSDNMKESDTENSVKEKSELKKTSCLKRDRKDSVTQKAKDDEDSDSKKESDTERSDSKKTSNRKEHRKNSAKNKAKDDEDSDNMKESDTEKSVKEKSEFKKTLSLKRERKDSVTQKANDDEDSDSRKESDTEKSDSKKTSNRKEDRKDSAKNQPKDDEESDSKKQSDNEKSVKEKPELKKTLNRKENRKDSITSKTKDDEDSDGMKESNNEKSKKSSNRKDSKSNKANIDNSSKKDKEKQMKPKKFKHIRIIDDSSTSSKEELQNVQSLDSADAEVVDLGSDEDNSDNDRSRLLPVQNALSSKSNNGNDFDGTADNNDEEKVPQTTDRKTDDNKDNDSDQSEANKPVPQKPLIKCVSLTKLLKPDVLPKEERLKLQNKDNSTKNYKSSLKKDRHDKNPSRTSKKVNYEDENIFWAQKRKEVKAFKAKDFTVNVSRLPTMSVEFLLANKLKRITQNGTNIFEVTSTDTEKRSNKLSQQSTSKSKEKSPEKDVINKVKNDLLNDSDSEKSDSNSRNSLKYVTENVKNALLDESESDNDEVSKNQDQTEDRTENGGTINNKEDNDPPQKENSDVPIEKTEKTPDREISPTNDPDKVKSSLLKDSSDDSPKTPQRKDKRSDSTTPKSKRKHIMESMHAKKMLLTYSSSSETEDEQLNNVLKEIKDTLLKEISSGEENNVEKSVCKKLLTSSDSDEDIMKRVKKKRKLNKSKSPSLETKKGDEKSADEKENENDKDTGCIDQVDGTMDEQSCSSNSKMGRSRGKPGASSSQNSDTQDDKDVDGLTNLNTLNKTSRTRGSDKSPSTSSKREKKMPKAAPLITGEGLLEAPSSSDEASAAESEAADEDLPAVQLSGLNGSGIGHLAKDDLLGDSDSSSSNEIEKGKSSDAEDKKQDGDSDTEDNIKSKRRKANAIASSDSEAGSSRRKDQDVRMSDFEDSGEDSAEGAKKSKRKKKGSDSDGSAGGSSNEGGKKKRRRIKDIDESDGSGSDTENEGRNKHGRKNIRKVMGKNQLEEATKKAAREEKERMARIIERQKMYNNLAFDESGKPDEVVLDKVVLDFDPETKEPLIEVDRGLVKKLKPHQANGIKFMWDACFESVKRIKKDRGSGCILAHCMGLGKTLQVVSLTHTLLTHVKLTGVNRVLVVCPLSTVLNWVNEFRMWLKHAVRRYELDVYELSRYKQNSERAFQLSQWYAHGGVCVLGYEMFRNLSADNPKKYKKKMLKSFQEALVDPGPDLVVCDEGHLLKNEKTSLSQSMNRVRTRRRIVLTGTPLQNNLKEYYCMVQFVKPNLLGKYNEYLNRFVNPITNGQYTDSTEHDIRVMKRRSHVLHKMLDGAVQRRDYGVLAPFLPPKHEYVLFITLTEVQVKLYQHYLDNYARRPLAGKSSGFLFPDFQSLQRIWTHPLVLKYNSERYEIMQQKKRDKEEEDSEGSLVDFIDDESTPEESTSDESSDDSSDMSDDSRKKSKKKNKAKKEKNKGKDSKPSTRRGTRANPGMAELEDEELKDPDILEIKNENPTEWWINLVADDVLEDMRNSHKLVLLFEILRQCEAIGDKLLVFSQSLYSLDLIEEFLRKVDDATQDGRIDEKLGGHVGSWSPGVDYFRLDGSTSCENRSIWCKNFNREDNPRARLFLISTRAGGLGINLVAANRVVIFDVSWNPSHDVQSIFRVYRFGQKKPCYIYRFLAMGTMEEKIYERQVTKQAISKRVIDEQQIDRHYAANDLAELYMFEPAPPMPRPVPPVPKDRFFAEMLKEHEALIYKFHEHDSLLENKEEETLSEEERKAAWEDFENEKNKPPPAPFPSGWPMNGMMPNMLAQQQQQQLAYAALATMLRKEMPTVTDDQIRSMLPVLYGSNPALIQKLNDLYKYTPQAGMMNPGMMNSVMNASGAAAGMGGGGTSGLQYEPPWQRQQQQQQQMRLQQLMQQQQNAMGAKFYAGGLGSRDPVAMALQQQRAREIMLGDRGRARGRPPLQPRAPAAAAAGASGDVVNLDSD